MVGDRNAPMVNSSSRYRYAGVTTAVGDATSPPLYYQFLTAKSPRTKLLQCLVHDYDVVLVNDNPTIRMNGNKFSSVLRLHVSNETIIELFRTWYAHRKSYVLCLLRQVLRAEL